MERCTYDPKRRAGESRREWLRRVGISATGFALAGLGCDDAETDEPLLSDGDIDGDAGGDAGGGAGGDVGGGAGGAGGSVDMGPAPPPDLEPIRGDGSHPFDYIDTLVILQMENRSFDHFLGSLSLVEGRQGLEGLAAGMANPDREGASIPIRHLAEEWIIDPDPPHSRGPSLLQYNDGANDGFVRAWQAVLDAEGRPEQADWVMGYHLRDQLPVLYTLADNYTLCQRWHASALAPTWPNRYFSHAATSDGILANNMPLAEAQTPYPLLAERGLTYKTYFHSLYFTATIFTLQDKRAVKIGEFFSDAEAGTLPNVSIVEPSFFLNDDHPPSDIRMGQPYIATIYEALRRSPQWHRSMMLVFYDEHGGFHDHVPPPEPRGEERPEFQRLGFRVPGLVIGPLARRGHLLDTVIDHASVPSLICNLFGLEQLNDRARLAGDLGEALDVSLAIGANRPPPVEVPISEVGVDTMERALRSAISLPQLKEMMEAMGWGWMDSLPARRKATRDWLMAAKRMGTAYFKR